MGGGQVVAEVPVAAHVGIGDNGDAGACSVPGDSGLVVFVCCAAFGEHQVYIGSWKERRRPRGSGQRGSWRDVVPQGGGRSAGAEMVGGDWTLGAWPREFQAELRGLG